MVTDRDETVRDNEPVTDPQAPLTADQLDAGIKVSIGRKKHRMLRLG